MKVLLAVDLKPHGKKGEVIEVNDGYARNFLLPKKLAVAANSEVLNQRKQMLANEEKRRAEEKAAATEVYNAINNAVIDVPVRCGNGKLYGSVTNQDIAAAIKEKGFEIDKRNIKVKDSIRDLGKFDIEIKCYANMTAKVILNIIPQE